MPETIKQIIAEGPSWKWLAWFLISAVFILVPLMGSEIFSERRQMANDISELRSRMDRIEVQFGYIDNSLIEIKGMLRGRHDGFE